MQKLPRGMTSGFPMPGGKQANDTTARSYVIMAACAGTTVSMHPQVVFNKPHSQYIFTVQKGAATTFMSEETCPLIN